MEFSRTELTARFQRRDGGVQEHLVYRVGCWWSRQDPPSLAPLYVVNMLTSDFQNTQGIIFVVDSNDRERIPEAREELQRMLNEDELRDALLLVFANKQDLPNAMNAAEITDKLGLHSLRQRQWYVDIFP